MSGKEITVGCTVQLHGLQNSADLNGSKGKTGAKHEETGRWGVTLEGGRHVNVLPANLEVVEVDLATAKQAASFNEPKKAPEVKALGGYYSSDPDGYRSMRDKGRKTAGEIKSTHFDHQLYLAVAKSLGDVGQVTPEELKTKIWPEVADGRGNRQELTCNERWTLRFGLGEFDWNYDARLKLINDLPTLDVMDKYDKKTTDPVVIQRMLRGPTLSELQEPAEKKAKGADGESVDDGLIWVDGLMLDRDMLIALKEAVGDDGVVDAREAVKIYNAAADGNVFTRCERWTLRFIFASHIFTDAAMDFLKEALMKHTPHNDNETA